MNEDKNEQADEVTDPWSERRNTISMEREVVPTQIDLHSNGTDVPEMTQEEIDQRRKQRKEKAKRRKEKAKRRIQGKDMSDRQLAKQQKTANRCFASSSNA